MGLNHGYVDRNKKYYFIIPILSILTFSRNLHGELRSPPPSRAPMNVFTGGELPVLIRTWPRRVHDMLQICRHTKRVSHLQMEFTVT
jgi:hypothetical protein